MTIRKVKGGYKIYHCHGSDKGKPLSKKATSKSKALAQHRAIMASRKKKG